MKKKPDFTIRLFLIKNNANQTLSVQFTLSVVHQTRKKRTLMKIQSSSCFLQEIISDLKSNVK